MARTTHPVPKKKMNGAHLHRSYSMPVVPGHRFGTSPPAHKKRTPCKRAFSKEGCPMDTIMQQQLRLVKRGPGHRAEMSVRP